MAARTVLPSGRRTRFRNCRSGSAYVTSTSSKRALPVECLGTTSKSVHQISANPAEDRGQGLLGDASRQDKLNTEFDPAGTIIQRHKLPVTKQCLKRRPFAEFHVNRTSRDQAIARGEGRVQALEGNADPGNGYFVLLLESLRLITPGQKLVVAIHVVYQRVHLQGAVGHDEGSVDGMHEPLLPGLGYSWIIVASPLQILMRRPVPGVRHLDPMAKTKAKAKPDNSIARNKKAWHDYFIEEEFEAGLALEGWEVKSLREGRAQLKESYVIIREGELFLFGAHFSPLAAASSHVTTDPTRMRKLLLHANEISKLIGAVERRGYTLVPLALYWKKSRAKLRIALAKGKKQHDKRATIRQREWDREQHRLLKSSR